MSWKGVESAGRSLTIFCLFDSGMHRGRKTRTACGIGCGWGSARMVRDLVMYCEHDALCTRSHQGPWPVAESALLAVSEPTNIPRHSRSTYGADR